MSEVYFYHLTQSPLEQTLPMLLRRARDHDWRVMVRGTDAARLDWLDEKLWIIDDGFLPHGRAGSGFDADQPILLSEHAEIANAADCLISVDGAALEPAEIAARQRGMILFDGNDGAAVDHARGQWKALTAAGLAAKYWSQESGKWQMKAEHKPQ